MSSNVNLAGFLLFFGLLANILLLHTTDCSEECWICADANLTMTSCNNSNCSITNLPSCTLQLCGGNCSENLCSTIIEKKDGNDGQLFVQSFCLQQCSSSVALRHLFTATQLNGHIREVTSNTTWRHECGNVNGCNGDFSTHPFIFNNQTMSFAEEVKVPEKTEDVGIFGDGVTLPVTITSVCATLAISVLLVTACLYKGRNGGGGKIADNGKCKYAQQSLPDDSDSWDASDQCSLSTYKTKVDSASSSVATQYTRGSNGGDADIALLPIQRRKKIASGRYAKVYEAVLVQDKNDAVPVAVKAFSLRNYGAWRQEIDMLSESWIHHENIIEYYTAEQRTIRNHLEYWLITAYYKNGNLANFLVENSLLWSQLNGMILSIAEGLSYLHAERDMMGKPKVPIAHRDIKSTNILVKDNLISCVIADFGLSLKLEPGLTREDCANAGQVGTPRYMAPELLERLINLFDPESFKRADVYAMALVIWEMLNCCEATQGMSSPYQPAYGDKVKEYPTKHQMTMLVCRDRVKPEIKTEWLKHRGMARLSATLVETWEYTAEERITAGCLVERMKVIVATIPQEYTPPTPPPATTPTPDDDDDDDDEQLKADLLQYPCCNDVDDDDVIDDDDFQAV